MRLRFAGHVDSVDVERRYLRKDGGTFWGRLTGRRLLNAEGQGLGLVGVIWAEVTADFARKHGPMPGRGAVVIGMGSMGAARLNAGSDLDLAGVYAHRLQGIEVLDLTDAGATTLTLRALDVARLSRTSNTLTILGGDDVIVVAELAGAGFVPSGDGTWSNGVLTLVVQGGTADVSL